ncbi:MAG: 50S ribosomal protein L18 [Calditrichaeota bacterium]|nr:50S ribosomal protein L18 [Calditrichota bacterium]
MTDLSARLKRLREQLARRRMHIRKTVSGSADRPRLVVFRSNEHIYAQLIDDNAGTTITGCSSLSPALKEAIGTARGRITVSKIVGMKLAELARAKGIEKVAFDRNGRKYHGRVKALADGAREGGLQF